MCSDIKYYPCVLVEKPFFVDLGEGEYARTYVCSPQLFTTGDELQWIVTDKAPFASEFFYGGDTEGSCCIKILMMSRPTKTSVVKYFPDLASCNKYLGMFKIMISVPGYLEVTRVDGSKYTLID